MILKVTSENVAKVQKWWLQQFLNSCHVFAYFNFYKQHLLQVKFYRRNETNRGFHLIPKTPFQWMNPKVIGSYTHFIMQNNFSQNSLKISKTNYQTNTSHVCTYLKCISHMCVVGCAATGALSLPLPVSCTLAHITSDPERDTVLYAHTD